MVQLLYQIAVGVAISIGIVFVMMVLIEIQELVSDYLLFNRMEILNATRKGDSWILQVSDGAATMTMYTRFTESKYSIIRQKNNYVPVWAIRVTRWQVERRVNKWLRTEEGMSRKLANLFNNDSEMR